MSAKEERPVIFGEVLFDCFPDGKSVLGGAPFNVAWHLQGFGLNPLMISRIGDDRAGKRVLQAMREWNMDCSGLQIDSSHPTGQVAISMNDGEPSYDIVQNQAYDNIVGAQALDALNETSPGLFYHGSLAARDETSQKTLETLLNHINAQGAKVFVNINLRPPWWTLDKIQSLLDSAAWVKLNEHELRLVSGSNPNPEKEAKTDLYDLAKSLFRRYELELLVVTCGDQGAFCVAADGIVTAQPVKVDSIIDTVGAGDSFSAVFITGLLQKWPLSDTLSRALTFAAAVCQIQGATNPDPMFYKGFLAQWELDQTS